MSKNDLRKQLQELIINGEATYREYAQTTDRVNALLASAYLEWRDFQADPEFLEKEYKKAGITYRIRNKNKIPFRPYWCVGLRAKVVERTLRRIGETR